MREAYEFKVDHTEGTTSACFYDNNSNVVYLDEWFGRSLYEFRSGMAKKGKYLCEVEEHEISGRKWTVYRWTR